MIWSTAFMGAFPFCWLVQLAGFLTGGIGGGGPLLLLFPGWGVVLLASAQVLPLWLAELLPQHLLRCGEASLVLGLKKKRAQTSVENILLKIHYAGNVHRLKGPKREIFDSGVFAHIRPIWIGDLGTRPKNYNFDGLGLKIAICYLLALSPTTQKNCKRCRLHR